MSLRDQSQLHRDRGSLDRIRMLAVDGSAAWLIVLSHLLEEHPRIERVDTARDGIAALEQAAFHKPHVVLMDVQMPHMSGLEAATAIRVRHPDICVLMMSVLDDENIRAACRATGAHDFVPKIHVHSALLSTVFRVAGSCGVMRDCAPA